MRKTCLDCVRKHIAQAGILAMEVLMGHPEHYWWAIGHLAEAEHEAFTFPVKGVRRSGRTKHRHGDCQCSKSSKHEIPPFGKDGYACYQGCQVITT